MLESIYIEELQSMFVYAYKPELSPTHLQIRVVPEEYDEAKQGTFVCANTIDPVLLLDVQYTQQYPDEVPELHIYVLEDGRQVLGTPPPEDEEPVSVDPREGVQSLSKELGQVANESLGMPMVFTLASHLRESLTDYMARQAQEAEKAANEKREEELRAEEEKFRGTAVTVERFNAWRIEFMKKQETLRAQKEEAYVASLTPKEREEYRRMKAKPTGREIFAKPDARVEEEKTDETVKEVDFSLYSREDREKQAREDDEENAANDGYVDDMDE